jgi:hypothetical protein
VGESSGRHASDRDDVRSHQRDGRKRQHGVECHRASDVNERDDQGEADREDDRVDGYPPGLVNLVSCQSFVLRGHVTAK